MVLSLLHKDLFSIIPSLPREYAGEYINFWGMNAQQEMTFSMFLSLYSLGHSSSIWSKVGYWKGLFVHLRLLLWSTENRASERRKCTKRLYLMDFSPGFGFTWGWLYLPLNSMKYLYILKQMPPLKKRKRKTSLPYLPLKRCDYHEKGAEFLK